MSTVQRAAASVPSSGAASAALRPRAQVASQRERHVLAVGGVADRRIELAQDGGRKGLDVEAVGIRARLDVADVRAARDRGEQLDRFVDDGRIDQRAVAGDTDDGAVVVADRAGEATEDVVERSAIDARPEPDRDVRDDVILGPVARREHDLGGARRVLQAAQQQREHRLTADVGQDLARQPRRAGARLHDDDRIGHRRAVSLTAFGGTD